MKQFLSELRAQFSFKEWFRAFFLHVMTAGKPTIKGGAKLTQTGEQLSFNERFEYLKNGHNQR